jgi:hypothetical protein
MIIYIIKAIFLNLNNGIFFLICKQANIDANTTNNVAKEMAKMFFEAKLAEVEVANASVNVNWATNPKVVPLNSSDAIAKMLDEVTKAAQEAQDAALASSTAAELAQKHAQYSLVN